MYRVYYLFLLVIGNLARFKKVIHLSSSIPQIKFKLILLITSSLLLSGCSSWTNFSILDSNKPSRKLSPRVVSYGTPVPKGGGVYKIGKPYQVKERWYYPKEEPDYEEVGVASWYGHLFHGRYTANGEVYDMDALTAAHPTLPIPSYVRVTNRENGRSLVLRVNDRGPYANDRIIDLSRYSARLLGFEKRGTASVRVTYLRPAPLNGNDSYERRYLANQRWNKQKRYRRYAYKRPRYKKTRRYDNIRTGSLPPYRNTRKSNPRNGYVIQAGAFYNQYNARRMRGRLTRYGRTYIKTLRYRRYPMYRVLLGPFRSKRRAERTLQQLAYSGINDAIIVNK